MLGWYNSGQGMPGIARHNQTLGRAKKDSAWNLRGCTALDFLPPELREEMPWL